MNTRASLFIATLLALTFAGCSQRPPAATPPQPVTFSGFTNSDVGVFTPAFAAQNTNFAAAIKQWLADGTNSAIFTITNRQSCAIIISPFACIYHAGPPPAYVNTPVLNAPGFDGIVLMPGQVSTIQIAILPHQAPWRMQLSYTRDDEDVGFFKGMRALIFRKKIVLQTYTIESDLINQ